MARAITMPAPPASPVSSRSTSRISIEGVTAHSPALSTNRAIPTSSGTRRPTRSAYGPTSSCPRARPIMQADSESWPAASVVPRSVVSAGSPGR
jgi:hypothetical protein